MNSKKITFINQAGKTLSGRIEFPPQGQIETYAIFAHCFTCGKNQYAARHISRLLALNNVAVLRFDFTGIGESTGNFSNTNFTSNASDIEDAARYLSNNYEAPKLLIGHSWGGTAALLAAGRMSDIKAVCTIGSPYDPKHIEHILQGKMEEVFEKGHAEVDLGPNTIKVNRQFLKDIHRHSVENEIKNLNKPLMIFHSPQDRIVGIQNAKKIYKAAHHPKSFISLDKADHLLTDRSFVHLVADMIGSWSDHYIGVSKDKIKEETTTPYQTVARIANKKYTTQIWSGPHHWIADEPRKIGGDDLGPSPYDMLSAALGTCTAMTLRMYANRKDWDLQEVEVHVENSKQHLDDLSDEQKASAKIDVFHRYIRVKGNLEEHKINRLLEIADKCPVHKTLSSSSKVVTELLEKDV